MAKLYIKFGERHCQLMNFSEVCVHMKIAAEPMDVELLPSGMVQLYRPGSTEPFSMPVTTGEAGVYWDEDGHYIEQATKTFHGITFTYGVNVTQAFWEADVDGIRYAITCTHGTTWWQVIAFKGERMRPLNLTDCPLYIHCHVSQEPDAVFWMEKLAAWLAIDGGYPWADTPKAS